MVSGEVMLREHVKKNGSVIKISIKKIILGGKAIKFYENHHNVTIFNTQLKNRKWFSIISIFVNRDFWRRKFMWNVL